MAVQEVEWTNQIIDIIVIKICIANTVVEFDPSANNFKENLYRGGGVLTLGAPLLIRLMNVSIHPCLLQCNHRTPSAQLICITTIYIKGWYKQNNNNPDYKDAEAKKGSSDSYRATTWLITKCNKIKWYFFWFLGMMIWFNILDSSINQDCMRFFLFRSNKISSNMHTRKHA